MFYLWKYKTSTSDKFFKCGIEQFNGWTDVPWTTGEKIDPQLIPNILRYYAVNKLNPEDFPMTGSYTQLLVSDKIANILKKHDVEGIDYYESVIIKPNGEEIKGYFTLNLLYKINCLDNEKSVYETLKFGPAEVYEFKKISLDETKIPPNLKLFRLKEDGTLIFIHETIKDSFDKELITGVGFERTY